MNLDDLISAGFVQENWPESIPMPDESILRVENVEGGAQRYSYECTVDGKRYGAYVELDPESLEVPAEGVVFMLNQFAYLYRAKPDRVLRAEGEELYKASF